MRYIRWSTFGKWFAAAILAFSILAIPTPSFAGTFVGISVNFGPPPIPYYQQPMLPGPGYIWEPGYWAWGPYGYYWVPGTWVFAPSPGLLWTPGWWGWHRDAYYWHRGYWARHVGYYGGINYGYGYYGRGYVGGGWHGNVFRYNAAINNVNRTIVHNVYYDRSVVVNRDVTRTSYNGGEGGVIARPTVQERAALQEPRIGMTRAQVTHARIAAHDRTQFATFNHGTPADLAAPRPYTMQNRPADFQRVAPQEASQARAQAQSHVMSRPESAGRGGHGGGRGH